MVTPILNERLYQLTTRWMFQFYRQLANFNLRLGVFSPSLSPHKHMENKLPLPPGVQEQVDLFYADYPPKEAKAIIKQYLGLVMSEKYRSLPVTKLEERTIIRTRPKPRVRVSTPKNEPKTTQKSTSKSSRT